MLSMWAFPPFLRAVCFFLLISMSTALPARHSRLQDAGCYDFIIVGGGNAGLALANRLSESGTQSVLVLEAGGSPEAVASYQAPGALLTLLGGANYLPATLYMFDRVARVSNRLGLHHTSATKPQWAAIELQPTAINGLTYGRGSAGVYDLWKDLGNEKWSWNDVLPYFVKSTTFHTPVAANVTGQGYDASLYSNGPVQVGYPGYVNSDPGSEVFVDALSIIGVPITNELNGGNNTGAKQEMMTIDTKYHRSSSYDNYYMQAKNRTNLKVLPFSPVHQVILEKRNASVIVTGVVYLDYASGQTFNATAGKEVIISAGSIQTPQLLMLSGIGPAETLAKYGIQKVVANENIGKNLQDHTYFSVYVEADSSISYDPLFSDVSNIQAATAEFQNSQGPFIASPGPSFAFQQIPNDTLKSIGASALHSNQAHIEYYYESEFYPNYPTPQYSPTQYNTTYVSFTAGLIAPLSRGNISIKSNFISDPPQIDLQYYTDPTDQAVAIYAFKNLRKVLAQFATTTNYTIGPDHGEVAPGPSVETDEEILEYIRSTAVTVWHASGTCAMLPQDKGGVVDARLRVYGVEGLRIVDASIFPIIPDQHTQGPTYMVAEKAASIIREDWSF